MPWWLSPAGEEVLLASHQAVLGAGSCRWRENCLTMMQTARPATWTRTSRLKRNRAQRPHVFILPHCFLLSKMTPCSTSFFSFSYVGSAVQKEDQWAMYMHTHAHTHTLTLPHTHSDISYPQPYISIPTLPKEHQLCLVLNTRCFKTHQLVFSRNCRLQNTALTTEHTRSTSAFQTSEFALCTWICSFIRALV